MTNQPKKPMKLTNRQQETLDFIRRYIGKHGYAPSLREIAQGVGIRQPNSVSAKLKALERKGWIRRQWGRWRGIEVLAGAEAAA